MTALIFLLSQILLIGGITMLERRRHPGPTDWARNLQVWALSIGAGFLFLRFFQDWKGLSLIDGTALPFLIAFPIFVLVRDFLEFAFHYAQHRCIRCTIPIRKCPRSPPSAITGATSW